MIVSVSRRTDIPAFYMPWFIRRLSAEEVWVRNPYRPHQVSRIRLSSETVDGFVFWSKNPKPMLPYLDQLRSYPFYIQYTLTPYAANIEPRVGQPLDRLKTFEKLAKQLSPKQLVWRYDPILFNEKYTLTFHKQNFQKLCSYLCGMTDLCILSFIDFYPSIKNQLKKYGIHPIPYHLQTEILQSFQEISHRYQISLAACAEADDLPIKKSACIDAERLSSISDIPLSAPKAKSQRPSCGCCESVDIGSYQTCPGGCVYCYANRGRSFLSPLAHDPKSPLLFGHLTADDRLTDRVMPLYRNTQISMF